MPKLDVRTVKKDAPHLGGVWVVPGTLRFFENRVKEARDANGNTAARYLHSLRGTKAALDEVFGSGKVVSLFREKSAGAGLGR